MSGERGKPNPERKPGRFEKCKQEQPGCDEGKNHICMLEYPHKGHKCVCERCGYAYF